MNRRAALSSPQRSAGRRTARSCSLRRMVSPWIRAALVRDAGWLALRGQRDARSNSELFCSLAQIVVVPNNCAV